ncbi:hypothetical protein COOONC_10978 [Cooperia oncophora]
MEMETADIFLHRQKEVATVPPPIGTSLLPSKEQLRRQRNVKVFLSVVATIHLYRKQFSTDSSQRDILAIGIKEMSAMLQHQDNEIKKKDCLTIFQIQKIVREGLELISEISAVKMLKLQIVFLPALHKGLWGKTPPVKQLEESDPEETSEDLLDS